MESKIVFYEKQQFRQWWLWLLFLSLFAFLLYKFIVQKDYGTIKNWQDCFPLVIPIGICILFWIMKMETTIKEDGIYINFYPLLWKIKFYPWQIIENIDVIKYNALLDYGGWGIRIGAYNVYGNKGFKITFKSGNKLLIGTQKSEEIKDILKNLNYDKKII